jgi:regulatory protein
LYIFCVFLLIPMILTSILPTKVPFFYTFRKKTTNYSMKKYISTDEALTKLQKYCAFQERCHKEVRSKLLNLNIFGDDLDSIISDLIENGFLNEMRYATAFVRGKFKIKKWGKFKIIRELKKNQISEYCIEKAIESELPYDDYLTTLEDILKKKNKTLKEKNPFTRNQKLAKFATGKGFESPLIWETLKNLKI